jgi:hypothetical protein
MVVAPSGAGKSSLLRAGLLPYLADGGLPGSATWPVLVLTPTADPGRAGRPDLRPHRRPPRAAGRRPGRRPAPGCFRPDALLAKLDLRAYLVESAASVAPVRSGR